jgi:[protein-PII] uridylyltransferase
MLSETAFKRDLDDPKTIEDFVERVQSPERLRLLLLITVADIRAVGPAIWNRWKGGLMRDLYHRAMLRMGIGIGESMQQLTIDEKLLREVPDEARDVAQQFLRESLPTGWWYRPREEQVASIRAYAAQQRDPVRPAIITSHDPFRGVSEVTLALAYTPQLFRLLAGVMAWIGASIVSARTIVLGSGVAITTLGIQDMEGNSFEGDAARLAPLAGLITTALAGELDFAGELPRRRALSRGREVAVEPAVFIDNQVSAEATVIEVNARDRLGLLYDMLGGIADCQLQVTTAHIATYGQKAVDVFYVKDAYGIKITHPAKLATIEQALLDACGAAS